MLTCLYYGRLCSGSDLRWYLRPATVWDFVPLLYEYVDDTDAADDTDDVDDADDTEKISRLCEAVEQVARVSSLCESRPSPCSRCVRVFNQARVARDAPLVEPGSQC